LRSWPDYDSDKFSGAVESREFDFGTEIRECWSIGVWSTGVLEYWSNEKYFVRNVHEFQLKGRQAPMFVMA